MDRFVAQLKHDWIAPIVLSIAIAIGFGGTIVNLYAQWMGNDDFSHGMLIIPISIWLAWERRSRLQQLPRRVDGRALWMLAAGMALYVIGELGAELFTTRTALLAIVIGSFWLLYGIQWVKALCFPLLFLFLMLPLPGFIYRNLTFPLQIISSKWSVAFLNVWGILAYREGNVIDLGFTRFQVVEACNGLRFILPLFTLGILFAFWKPKALWKRLTLVAATVPIALFANIVRIGGTGILSKYFGAQVAEGFFHGFSGWAVFMLSFALFFLLNSVLNKLPGKAVMPTEKTAGEPAPERPADEPPRAVRPVAAALALILLTPLLVSWLGHVPPRQLKQPLDRFPLAFEGRTGRPQTMESAMWAQVGGQSYFMADYHRDGALPLNFYVAYYEYQRKGGDFIHSPKLCLPGAGWFIDLNHTRAIDARGQVGPKTLKFNELIIRKGAQSQLVYFWYQGRERNFTNEFSAKFWMVWDGIWRRRTDGALVRLIMPLSENESPDDSRREMDRFAWAVYRNLDDFLP
jgi:exosortase D (VPLPA-CTERM-specific)